MIYCQNGTFFWYQKISTATFWKWTKQWNAHLNWIQSRKMIVVLLGLFIIELKANFFEAHISKENWQFQAKLTIDIYSNFFGCSLFSSHKFTKKMCVKCRKKIHKPQKNVWMFLRNKHNFLGRTKFFRVLSSSSSSSCSFLSVEDCRKKELFTFYG